MGAAAMMVLTRAELDAVERCDECGEEHAGPVMQLTARCHPRAGLAVAYERGAGVLHFHCAKCDRPIAWIAVAETAPGFMVRH
jgi:hypothetical protein